MLLTSNINIVLSLQVELFIFKYIEVKFNFRKLVIVIVFFYETVIVRSHLKTRFIYNNNYYFIDIK